LPALLAWSAAWLAYFAASAAGLPGPVAVAAGSALGVAPAAGLLPLAWGVSTPWRRVFVAAGFPLSLLGSGLSAGLPAWAWLLPLAMLALAYPVTAWRDAPVYPTPRRALAGLDALVPLRAGARVLDAGCGLGHGLQALRAVFPSAQFEGVEWSWPLRLLAARRCPWAQVRQGDMWRGSWADHDLVYLFQRPESMGRALAKARAEMRPGTWLASLEFEAAGETAHGVLRGADGRPVWIYRIDGTPRPEIALKFKSAVPKNPATH